MSTLTISTPVRDFSGQPLDKLCREPMDLTTFLRLAIRIAGALAELHQQGIIHKNIKPQSILVDSDTFEVRITDLRIAARSHRATPEGKNPNVVEGTLAYMSPEQTGRMNRWVDDRTDLYSLGVTFYEMLTGELPFQVTDALSWVHCHIARLPEPPSARRPAIPGPVSDIVMKLLAKAAEDRYQSAHGLQLDLETCLTRWLEAGRLDPFPLGSRDVPDRLQIPQKLYGREVEVESLTLAFERVVRAGTPELVLVSGYSGIGKSALVHELQRPVVRERGSFVSGKFDQYKRDIPYSTIVHALRELVLELFTRSEEEMGAVAQRMKGALGENGQLIIDMIPEVALIIGKQPPPPEVALNDTQHRQDLVFRQFLGVFARAGHPVTLFLDDLQWADAASLKLLAHLAAHPETKHVLIIGAYRDNEVTPSHPLMLAVSDLRKAGAAVRSIVLGPLSTEHLGPLVGDALHRRPEEVSELARLLHDKTAGNPFFVMQFLMRLHEEALLTFDAGASQWRWDLPKIKAKGFTDNVVDLLIEKLRRLPPETQDTLKLAACLGSRVEVQTLAAISGRTEEEIHQRLLESVKVGLILQNGEMYQFLHDRVQQAGYSLIKNEQRAELHLRIGRTLLSRTTPENMGERIFEIVNQLNLGAAGITDAAEKRRLAELNLEAGRKAKASSAWQPAARFLSLGIKQLGADSWESDYELTYALHFELSGCEYLNTRHDEAERLLLLLLDKCKSETGKAEIVRIQIDLHLTKGEWPEAVDAGLDGLRLYGIDLPAHPSRTQVEAEYEEVQKNLNGRPIEALLTLPRMTDPDMRAAMRVLGVLWVPAMGTDANLVDLHLGRMINLCLRHGNTDDSASGYASWGLTVMSTFHQYQDGHRFGKLGYSLMKKYDLVAYEAKINFSLYLLTLWVEPLQKAMEYVKACFLAALERGDMTMACYSCLQKSTLLLAQGAPLKEFYEESERLLGFVRSARDQDLVNFITSFQRYIQNMRGRTKSFSTFNDDQFDEEAFEAGLMLRRQPVAILYHWLLKLMARFMSGDRAEAMLAAAKVRELSVLFPPGQLQFVNYHVYLALLLSAIYEEASAEEQRAYDGQLEAHKAQLAEWAESCPENFLCLSALVSAEIARVKGDNLEAERLYEQAIRSARERGFAQHEGLANELAGKYYLRRGLTTTAKGHLREAHAAYDRWGADGKLRQMEQEHLELLDHQRLAAVATFTTTPEQIDIFSVTKASQSISGEILLPKLVETLIRIVIEAAGAERGYLLRNHGGDWAIEVEAKVDGSKGNDIEVLQRGAALSSAALPDSILNYVKRTRERVLLDDAAEDAKFSVDAYIARQRPRSVLCLPLVRQAELVGLVYLENNLTAGAFTPDRLSVLELLASQAAISLENASLYANLSLENAERKRAEAEVRQLNEDLELRVLDRTAQLSVANRELEAFSSSVSHDLRSPLRTINGFSLALLEDYGDRLDDEGKSYLAHVRTASQRMSTLIDDMLNLSRVTRSTMERRKVDLSALVREIAAELIRDHAPRKVEFVIADGLVASGDEPLLRIALQNLLGNAWKFTSKRGEARIEFAALSSPDGRPTYFVRDNGAGFDMARADKMFSPFERLHSTADFAGTGIGLATVQRAIDRHGGRVWAEGAVGQGAKFYFTL